ncbi:Ca(2+)-dependent cysteine protease [Phlyctochytrium bullatum]|nr:Ca(2+)-dependent cysteine protease [Phlyctochytrium bullatum]
MDPMEVDSKAPATPQQEQAAQEAPAPGAETGSAPAEVPPKEEAAADAGTEHAVPSDVSAQRRHQHKALLIGIRYLNTGHPLAGPHNDVRNVHTWLTYTYPFHPQNILILTEDQPDPAKWPTRDNILRALRWLSEGSKDGDRLFLHYSGHGGAVLDEDGDEVDGMDESIIPLDYEETGEILDDDIFRIAVAPLPKGCRLTAIFDCCHSGSILDLQYSYKPTGELEIQRNDARSPILEAVGRGIRQALVGHTAHAKAELAAAFKFFKTGRMNRKKNKTGSVADGDAYTTADGHVVASDKALKARSTAATVVQFSACNDYERSADLTGYGADASQSIGIMSWAILQCLAEDQHPSLVDLFAKTRKLVSEKFKQSVTLSTGFPMDINREVFSVL